MVRGKRIFKLMQVFNPKQVCKIMGCSINTLKKRIKQGVYPKPIKNNMRYGFSQNDINNFFQKAKNRAVQGQSKGWV